MANKRITVSEARKQKLYEAVTEKVMDVRVIIMYSPQLSKEQLDRVLYDLQLVVGNTAIEALSSL